MPKALRSLRDEMQPGAVLFFPLCDRQNSSAKASESGQFLLYSLQTFMPLAVSDLTLRFISGPIPYTPILVVQLLKVCDLVAETARSFREALLADPQLLEQLIRTTERR